MNLVGVRGGSRGATARLAIAAEQVKVVGWFRARANHHQVDVATHLWAALVGRWRSCQAAVARAVVPAGTTKAAIRRRTPSWRASREMALWRAPWTPAWATGRSPESERSRVSGGAPAAGPALEGGRIHSGRQSAPRPTACTHARTWHRHAPTGGGAAIPVRQSQLGPGVLAADRPSRQADP
jgi:hypothetical protein